MLKISTNVSEREQKEIQVIASFAEDENCTFLFTQEAKETYSKKYNYWPVEQKLSKYAADAYGQISDAYILYAITCLGPCTLQAIKDFLRAFAMEHKDILIAKQTLDSAGPARDKAIEKRIKVLSSLGFIFIQSYQITNASNIVYKVSIYSTDKESQTFMNQKLSKTVVIRNWVMAEPLSDLIGDAAASYVCASIGKKSELSLLRIKEDALKTKEMGTLLLPPVITLKGKSMQYLVMVMPAFLIFDATYMTKEDYITKTLRKRDIIKNYLYAYNNEKSGLRFLHGEAYVVLVAQSESDFDQIIKMVVDTRQLVQYEALPNIFITSEGAIRNLPEAKDAFFQLVDENGEGAYIKRVPPFMVN